MKLKELEMFSIEKDVGEGRIALLERIITLKKM